MARRKSRELAFILLFEQSFDGGVMEDVIERAQEAREIDPDPFACSLAKGTAAHITELDEQIDRLATNWRGNRLSKVSRALLRLALYEMQYVDETPVSVAINEAVELAKKYGDDGESGFINGILGTASREQGSAGETT
ncbi:MAG: transcription antitermination factor NusB [Clostridia bacterium]|nr:transcription antitermination factor NusB [Clostridia bacterium]